MHSMLTLFNQSASPNPLAGSFAQYAFTEGSGGETLNQAGAKTASPNLLVGTEGMFNNTDFWSPTGITATENAGMDPFGNNNATRLQCGAGSSNFVLQSNITLPVTGNYTQAIWVKSNTGATQHIRMTFDASTFSADLPVTTTWTRVSFTTSLSAGAGTGACIPVWPDAAGDAMDILVYGPSMFEGSVDLGYNPQTLDMFLSDRANPRTTKPTWGTDLLSFGGAGYCLGFSSMPVTTSQISVYVLCRWPSAVAIDGHNPLLGTDYTDNQFYTALDETSQGSTFRFNDTSLHAALLFPRDDNWHVHGFTYDGTTMGLGMDGVIVATLSAPGLSPVTIKSLFLGGILGASYCKSDVAHVDAYTVGHSASQFKSVCSAIKAIGVGRGLTLPGIDKMVVVEGDSITFGLGSGQGYTADYLRSSSPTTWFGANNAVSGSGILAVIGRQAVDFALYDASRSVNIYSMLIGTNDLINDSSHNAAWQASVLSNLDAAHAAGFKTLLGTIPPNNNSANLTSNRALINPWIRSLLGTRADAIFDWAADPTMGPDSAAADTTLYYDGTHPTLLGQQKIAPIWGAALSTLL